MIAGVHCLESNRKPQNIKARPARSECLTLTLPADVNTMVRLKSVRLNIGRLGLFPTVSV
jgi:hypothetical protein